MAGIDENVEKVNILYHHRTIDELEKIIWISQSLCRRVKGKRFQDIEDKIAGGIEQH